MHTLLITKIQVYISLFVACFVFVCLKLIVPGTIYGYVRDEDGRLYVLDGMTAMGEDKDLLF